MITLNQFKEYRDIKSSEQDGAIQSLIDSVEELVENYCNRSFTKYVSTDKIEYFDAKTNLVELTEFPVISVTHVKTSKDGGLTQTTLTENDPGKGGYLVNLEDGIIHTQKQYVDFLPDYDTPYKSLEVAYRAGYTTVPKDLQLCALDLVEYYRKGESTPTRNMLGATIDNPLPYIANSFPPHIRRILDLYRFSP